MPPLNCFSKSLPRPLSISRRPVRRRSASYAQARRHLPGARYLRRHRGLGRGVGWTVSLRHAVSVAAGGIARGHAAVAARLQRARRQLVAHRRPDQSRTYTATAILPCRKIPCMSYARCFSGAIRPISDLRSTITATVGRSASHHAVRQRLRRPVRGARPSARASRLAQPPLGPSIDGNFELFGSRPEASPDRLEL